MYGGMFKFDTSLLKLTDYKKSDGSDMKFRHMSCVEYDPVNNWVWCGTGDSPLKSGKDIYPASQVSILTAHKYESGRGGGIAIYDNSGNILNHFTEGNSPLLNNRVTKIAYDKYANCMWVAHYGGIQCYDLASKTWSEITALKNDFSAGCNIYVDPYDTDKVYFSFSYLNYAYGTVLANADSRVFEYSKSSKIVKNYLIEDSVKGVVPLIAKTSANTLWITKGTYYLYKYDLTTSTVLEKIDIKSTIPEIATLSTEDKYTLSTPSAITAIASSKVVMVATLCGYTYKIPPVVGKPCAIKKYVLRVTDNGAAPSTIELINNVSMNQATATLCYDTPWSLITDPLNSDTLYMSSSDTSNTVSASILKSTDQGQTWTKQSIPSSSIMNLREIVAIPGGIIYGVRGSEYNQQNFSDFLVSGVCAFGGGLSHDNFIYNPSPASAPFGGISPGSIYASSSDSEKVAYCMMFMMLDGYYTGEARYGIFKQYPATGGGGYVSHMLVFEPKCAPYAPRVDEENMNTMIQGQKTIEIPLRSPGLPWAMDDFIPETINSGTVTVTDAADAPVTPSEIKYDAVGRKIVLTGDFSAATYKVTLKCGINGIKNIKGASLTNTRVDEFKDEITLVFGDTPVFKPDLSIGSINWTPVNPEIGKAVTLSVVIQNTGTIPASAGALDIYFDGAKIGSVSYAAIPAAGNITKTFDVLASKITAGNHPVRVVADTTGTSAEISETNNELEVNMSLSVKPDLQITAIAFSPAAPSVTDNVVMTITVKNTGAGPAAAGASDIKLDSVKTGAISYGVLAAGASQNCIYNISAGVLTVGAHTISVAADATNTSAELDETNNAMNKNITVTGKPELAISNLSWTPVSPAVGDTVTITARISNTGSVSAAAGLVYFYLKGSNVGSVSYGALTPGAYKDCSLALNTKYLPVGSYAVKAFADGTNTTKEINEANNERASTLVFSGKADLIVKDFWWAPVPPVSGSGLNFQIALSNIGIAISAGTTLDLYIDDVKAGSASVTAMAVNENRTIPLTVTGDKVKGGSHNIKVVIDPNNLMAELQKTNNVRIESLVVPAPDLRVSNVQFVPVVPVTGEKLQVKFLLDNISAIPAPGSIATIHFDGVPVATVNCPPLAGKAGQVVTGEINGKFITPGTHVVKVVVDKNNMVPESSKTNNTTEARISVVFPDLSISTIAISPASPVKGNKVTVSFTISNLGQAVANISGADIFLDGVAVGSVNAGRIPAKGTKAMSVIIDGSKVTAGAHLVKVYATLKDLIPELQTGNNLRVANFTAK
jgi:subtilase family serine protease